MSLFKSTRRGIKKSGAEIEPDEIFLDSSNLPAFDRNQFEGRLEKPIRKQTLTALGGICLLIFIIMIVKLSVLQIEQGEAYRIQSEMNRLRNDLIFAERGIIYDTNGIELAWNTPHEDKPFSRREYKDVPGLAHLLGYISYPLRDDAGVYYQKETIGIDGVEHMYDDMIAGVNGLTITETNALNEVQYKNVIRPEKNGDNLVLSIDADLTSVLHSIIAFVARESGFRGGVGVVMDIHTGEVRALTNYPEYDPEVLTEGVPEDTIRSYVESERTPFLNRAVSGLYTPGSIVKPFIALGALNEGVITPEKEILSTGELRLPNPFVEGEFSVFKDWKAHGYVTMRDAIAVSSDVYFYEIGGGFENQKGLGIRLLEEYVRMFGIGEETGIDLPGESEGIIPNPEWKEEEFSGDAWRVGDTYLTAIGQYGFQVTPIQMARAVSALANKGTLVTPHVARDAQEVAQSYVSIPEEYFMVVHEGMRQAVTTGTALGLFFPDIAIAAKTGTAEVGAKKEFIHSWTVGFFPYENPRYAFVILMERASAGTLLGSVAVAKRMFEWMRENAPDYYEGQ